MVQDYGEDSLGAAGVLDGLGGEEEVVGWGGDVGAVLGGCWGGGGGGFAEPFEEENYAVDGAFSVSIFCPVCMNGAWCIGTLESEWYPHRGR